MAQEGGSRRGQWVWYFQLILVLELDGGGD
jgi:hypothetical protein